MDEITVERKILYSLAEAINKTREELDALRFVSQSAISVLCVRPDLEYMLVDAIKCYIAADTADHADHPLTEAQQERRLSHIKRLLPATAQERF